MTSKTNKFRPSPALVVACIALFMAMTGSALALGKNTVRSPQIVNGAVKAADLGRDSVRSGKILNDGIYAADLADNSVRAGEIAADAVGSEEIGPDAVGSDEVAPDSLGAGDLGPASVGSSEVANESLGKADIGSQSVGASELVETVVRTNVTGLNVGANGAVTANCLAGEQMIGGGGQPGHYGVETTGSRPDGNGWRFLAKNNTAATNSTITAYVVCLKP